MLSMLVIAMGQITKAIEICLQENWDPAVQSFTGVRSVVHENYSPNGNYDFDITVIELPTPLTFNNYVQPVCLPRSPVAAGTTCVATGWGRTQGRQNRT